jgi:hypothetical protein
MKRLWLKLRRALRPARMRIAARPSSSNTAALAAAVHIAQVTMEVERKVPR